MVSRPKKPCGPGVHLAGDLLGDAQEDGIAAEWPACRLRWLSSDMVDDLAERVLAVEHPAVGAGEQRVGDVADARLDGRARLGGGAGALDPLALQVVGNLAAVERALARLLHRDLRARDGGGGVEESDAPALAEARGPPLDAFAHDPLPLAIEPRQSLQRVERRRCQHIRVVLLDAAAKQ